MYTLRIVLLMIALFSVLPAINAQSPKYSVAHIGLLYPLSTNGRQANEYINSLSLHAIAGVSGAETGFSIAGFALFIRDSASGMQCSGFMNRIGGKSRGLQLAGFANFCRDSANGVQVAGFINQAGNANIQLAGFINIAKKVKGVQIAGFINIADSSDYPIGLVNIIGNGEKSIGISTDETLTSFVSFRSGGRKLYGILGMGYNVRKEALYAWEAGLGAHFHIAERLRVNAELVTIGMSDFKRGDYFRASLRAMPAWRFAGRWELFAGPTINYIRSEKGKGAALVTHYLWSEKEPSGILHGLYMGATGGIHMTL